MWRHAGPPTTLGEGRKIRLPPKHQKITWMGNHVIIVSLNFGKKAIQGKNFGPFKKKRKKKKTLEEDDIEKWKKALGLYEAWAGVLAQLTMLPGPLDWGFTNSKLIKPGFRCLGFVTEYSYTVVNGKITALIPIYLSRTSWPKLNP